MSLSYSELAWDLKLQGFPSCIPLQVYREMSTERKMKAQRDEEEKSMGDKDVQNHGIANRNQASLHA